MRLGFALPQVGPVAGPDSISAVAQRAEELGFDSLWVLDRILFPVNPQSPYPVGDGSLPDQYKRTLDPLETLTFAAAHTRNLALGTSILNLPWYNPVLLARKLFPEVAKLDGDQGARRLLDAAGDAVEEIALDDPAIALDIDTPEALRALTGQGPR